MSVQITVRNVPDEVRNELAARAARAGMSMQEYLRQQLERLARRPTIDQWLNTVRDRKSLTELQIGADVILAQRDADRR